MKPSRGYVYVATGEGYVREAEASAHSLRAVSPDAAICLITDVPRAEPAPFDTVLVRTDVQRNVADKLLALAAPYEHVIFLDTDTHLCAPIDEIFDLLERFDLALLQENQRGWDYTLPGVPLSFPEYNTGVIAFRQSAEVRDFFAAWRSAYDRLRTTQNLKSDQPAFRAALHGSTLRVASLCSEFHFLANVPNYVMWQVRLLHGRGDLPAIARMVNAELGPRAYVPHAGILRSFHGRKAWSRSLLHLLGRMLRTLLRPPRAAADLAPHKWWL